MKVLPAFRFTRKSLFFLLLLPVLITGASFLIAQIQALTRYDPGFFTPDYQSRYQQPSQIIEDIETAFQTGSNDLMAELQGTYLRPANFQEKPNMVFVTSLDRTGEYYNFLFNDSVTFHRFMARVKMHDGRYVLIPEGLYYYFDSGRWINVFGPPAIIWWVIVLILTVATAIYRWMARIRKQIF
jgi:hypothetical protein